jgi:transposase
MGGMNTAADLPDNVDTLKAMILSERAARVAAEAVAKAERVNLDIEIERLRLEIARLRREQFGRSSERSIHIEQLELKLEDLEETAAAAEVEREKAVAQLTTVVAFTRRKPARRPLPEHLPRTRVVHPGPTVCECCGGSELSKLGEDVTETLERIPARWQVIQHVREKFSCRACQAIGQPPAPFHPIARGRAGPNLLAEVIFNKYGLHLPLHRQSERFAREGVPIEVSTLADWVGAVGLVLKPLTEAICGHVLAAERLHADDTKVPVLAKIKARDGYLWTVVRDDRPFAGADPPAAAFFYSRDRGGEHAETFLGAYAGILQADAFSGFGRLYKPGRPTGAIIEAACWAHGRRKFFELAELAKAPIAIEAVKRIDEIFAIEREINGETAARRLAVRAERARPLVAALEAWLRANRAKVSGKAKIGNAIDYMLKRWPAFTRFLDDGRICLSNNAAERSLRTVAVGRKNWTFAGSDDGARRAAELYTLIETAKLNGIDPRAWLADVLGRIADHPAKAIDRLLPWAWKQAQPESTTQAAA